MSPFLKAGDPSWLDWPQLWAALVLLHVYIGAGIWWAFRIQRERNARRALSSAGEQVDPRPRPRPRRSLAEFLDEVYALGTLKSRAATALGALRSRTRAFLAARRAVAEDERASAA